METAQGWSDWKCVPCPGFPASDMAAPFPYGVVHQKHVAVLVQEALGDEAPGVVPVPLIVVQVVHVQPDLRHTRKKQWI